MKFRERVLNANPSLDHVPAGFNRYGHIMILRAPVELDPELGETILGLYSWCTAVYQHLTTTGQSRIPQLEHLAGEDRTDVLHRENNTKYLLDLARITFSGGNRHLRERLVDIVTDGEHLLDMFAAVGNLSMQPLVHNDISAILVEQNTTTYRYLQKTLELNKLDPRIALHMDCRSLELVDWADRIFMGYHEVDSSHIHTAVQAAKETATLHLHPIVSVGDWDGAIHSYHKMLEDAGAEVVATSSHQVKTYAPGLEHIELMVTIHS